MQFDYYYEHQSEQFTFYRLPKVLFTEPIFKKLSSDAKILYGLFLDRMSLSRKNGWIDEQGRVYIIFSINDIMEALGCAKQKAHKIMDELDSATEGIGLIERVRQGLSKPNLIYVKDFVSVMNSPENNNDDCETNKENNDNSFSSSNEDNQPVSDNYSDFCEQNNIYDFENGTNFSQKAASNPYFPLKYENQTSRSMEIIPQEVLKSNFKKYENQTSESMKIIPQEVLKSYPSNINSSNNELNKNNIKDNNFNNNYYNDNKINQSDSLIYIGTHIFKNKEELISFVDDHICMPNLIKKHREDAINIRNLIINTLLSNKAFYQIDGINLTANQVKEAFLELEDYHVDYTLFKYKNNYEQVHNVKSYLIAILYNSLTEASLDISRLACTGTTNGWC